MPGSGPSCLLSVVGLSLSSSAFLLSLLLTSAFGVASSFAPGFASYCVLRLLTGIAIGGNLPLAVSIVSEMLPPSARERSVVGLQLFNEARRPPRA